MAATELETIGAWIEAALATVAKQWERVSGQLEEQCHREPNARSDSDSKRETAWGTVELNETPVNPLRRWRWE